VIGGRHDDLATRIAAGNSSSAECSSDELLALDELGSSRRPVAADGKMDSRD